MSGLLTRSTQKLQKDEGLHNKNKLSPYKEREIASHKMRIVASRRKLMVSLQGAHVNSQKDEGLHKKTRCLLIRSVKWLPVKYAKRLLKENERSPYKEYT